MSKLLPMLDPFDEIKRLYFTTTKQTIERDMARALDLLTHMPTDEARQKAAGFMHGLADLRREWKVQTGPGGKPAPRPGPPAGASKAAGGRRAATGRGRKPGR